VCVSVTYDDLTLTTSDKEQGALVESKHDAFNITRNQRTETQKVTDIRKHG
jgi:hypothetical protein